MTGHAGPREADSRQRCIDELRSTVVVAVLRGADATEVLQRARDLAEAGPVALEVTTTVPGWRSIVRALATDGRCSVGVGTVLDVATVAAAADAGATFVVSPTSPPGMIAAAHQAGLLAVPGIATPTEAFRALQEGASVVKVFPAGPLGGPAYVRALRGPFPAIDVMVSGGVGIDEIPSYLAAGAWTVALSSLDPAGVAAFATATGPHRPPGGPVRAPSETG